VQQAIEVAEKNVDWMDRNYNGILEWLQEQNAIIENDNDSVVKRSGPEEEDVDIVLDDEDFDISF
jgi:hypothetical protein